MNHVYSQSVDRKSSAVTATTKGNRATWWLWGDLADVLLNIERERERINEQIARQLERVMRHRAELYQLMEKVPDGPGKIAVQEHYLYRVPWGVVAARLHYGKSYTRDLARRTVEELEKVRAD